MIKRGKICLDKISILLSVKQLFIKTRSAEKSLATKWLLDCVIFKSGPNVVNSIFFIILNFLKKTFKINFELVIQLILSTRLF